MIPEPSASDAVFDIIITAPRATLFFIFTGGTTLSVGLPLLVIKTLFVLCLNITVCIHMYERTINKIYFSGIP